MAGELVFPDTNGTTFGFPPAIRTNCCDLNSVTGQMGSTGKGAVFILARGDAAS